ncbi:aminotransferase class-III family protein [Mycobacterium xenopi 3993]|nr:aminotransferase class-III family protein [Mycobacterium xenopi 3993]
MPVYAARASGGIVEDVDGNRLIDLGSGIAVTTIGNAARGWWTPSARRSPSSPTPASW